MWGEVESSVDRSLECDRFFNLNLAAGSLTWTLHQQLGPNLTKNTIRLSLQTRFHCNNRISPFMSSHEFDWVEFFVFFFLANNVLFTMCAIAASSNIFDSPCIDALPSPHPPNLRPKLGQTQRYYSTTFDTDKQGQRMILTLLIDREWPLKMESCIGIMGFLSWRNLWFHGGRRKSSPTRLEKGRFKKLTSQSFIFWRGKFCSLIRLDLRLRKCAAWSLVADF